MSPGQISEEINKAISQLDIANRLIQDGSLPPQIVGAQGLETQELQMEMSNELAIGILILVERRVAEVREVLVLLEIPPCPADDGEAWGGDY
jgi:hypothetical protein